ncbi:uncharacterized protein [Periplaneta americana]|uniref:uncharacterized protein n=1 Tax=Periplaneta americana TaxID=6978 RepID=UPI0037E90083
MLFLCLLITAAVNSYPTPPCVPQDGACAVDVPCAIKEPEDCTTGLFRPNVDTCGCCPACVQQLGQGEPCKQVVIPATYECRDDLVCSDRTGTCVPPSAESPLVEEALFFTAHLGTEREMS